MFIAFVFVGLCLLTAADCRPLTRWHELESRRYDFTAYVAEYEKVYGPAEHTSREAVFNANLAAIKAHNRNPTATWKTGVNHLTDRTPEELKALRGYRRVKKPTNNHQTHVISGSQAPASVDWRTTGAISGVKDQGRVGPSHRPRRLRAFGTSKPVR